MSTGFSNEFTSFDQRAVIKVCGVGGGGGNAVGRMIQEGLSDVEFIAINTDAQALKDSPAGTRLQIGGDITGGLGSGARPEVGQEAAVEDRERITEIFAGADMVFLTAGLGGGTGTGGSPIIAEVARESGALTVAIVTMPFSFEGPERMANAQQGLAQLEEKVDTLIVVPNDRVAALSQDSTSFLDAFRQADDVLHNGVRAIVELITVTGLMNVDFADVRTIMEARGRALMGIGVAEGEGRAVAAAQEAMICPLLEQSSVNGARGVIVNITGGLDLTMHEVQAAVTAVQKAAHPTANIIMGAVVQEVERDDVQVTVIAAGFVQEDQEGEIPVDDNAVVSFAEAVTEKVAAQENGRQDLDGESAPEEEPAAANGGGSQVELGFSYDMSSDEQSQPIEEPAEDLGIPAFMRKRRQRGQ